MNASRKSFHSSFSLAQTPGQRGNAMIYVLLVIALFAALGFLLMRGGSTSETESLSDERANIYAGEILGVPATMKQGLDQMIYSGGHINKVLPADHTVSYTLPDAVSFSSGNNADKFFHPEGGGAIVPHLSPEAASGTVATPAASWYVGKFNDVEWTPSTAEDVVLTAWNIKKAICQKINERLNGSNAIPILVHSAASLLIDKDASGAGSNLRFTAAECAACEGKPAMCVQDSGAGPYAFYSIISAQ